MSNITGYYWHILHNKIVRKYITDIIGEAKYYSKGGKKCNRTLLNPKETNKYIMGKINMGNPCMISRFGSGRASCYGNL